MTDDGHWVIAIAHLIQTNKGFFGFFFFISKFFFVSTSSQSCLLKLYET